MSAFNVTL